MDDVALSKWILTNQLDAGRKYRAAQEHDDRADMDYQQGRIDTLHAVLDAIASQP